jgi:hypothetical protein
VRPVNSSKSRDEEFSRIVRSQGNRNWRRNAEPTGCSNTRLRDQFPYVERDVAVGRNTGFGNGSPATARCHHAFG